VAATNRNLAELAARGDFRQDLFYRLNVVSLTMPALRDRPGDVPLLAGYFVLKYSQRCKRLVTGISPAARRCLADYAWPGNVRELENAIERAVVLGSTEEVMPEDLPETVLEAGPPSAGQAGYYAAVREAKRQLITRAVEQADGNYTEAARQLGVHPNNLHRLLRNLDLRPPRAR
jgi:transcriptional regulator with PAS, ATPase and Fis domain